jgi:formate dehydrogenase (coenzyme F420) beta subunit
MNRLHQIVSDLFTSKMTDLVIGYEKGTNGKRRPVFITKAEDSEKLIFDDKCSQNLSVYLTKSEFKDYKKITLLATRLTMRSVIRLAGEHQMKDKELSFISIMHDNALEVISGIDALVTFLGNEHIMPSTLEAELMEKIDKMSREERFAFWKEQFSSCIKCYACRAACPMCYCTRCTVEINQPQWISVPSNIQGNFEYHIMRAMHMAGRCVDCGSCEAACPVGIPLNIITRRLIQDIEANIGPDILSPDNKNVLNTFQPDDKENFIK